MCVCVDGGGGSLGFVESPRPAASLLPLPEQSLPSCEPDLVTWLAAWGHCHATLSFGALRLRASARGGPATCPRSKVTFVRCNRLLSGLEQLLLDGGADGALNT